MTTIIVGDIGGTNARLRLLRVSATEQTDLRKPESIPTLETSSFNEVLHRFLDNQEKPTVAVFAIAGVARGTSGRFVNPAWEVKEYFSSDLENEFDLQKVVFLNDFEAAGYGCLNLQPRDFEQLNPGVEPQEKQRKVVMGPGTGLGEALLTYTDNRYSAWPGEGGHSDFAPHNDEEWRLAKFLMELVQTSDEYEHFRPCEGVSFEVCIAGVGAFHIYDFVRSEHPEEADEEFDKIWQSEPRRRMEHMMVKGLSGENKLCERSVNLWLRLFAYECGNLIAKNLPYGGVYLIGGLVGKNFSQILAKKERFIAALNTKPRHICDVISKIPIYMVSNEDVGMLGTVKFAKDLLRI